jgi:hypothetical protein
MFFSRRRGGEPDAKAASVPMLTSRGLAVALARRVVFAAAALVARFAGVDLPVDFVAVDFLAVDFLAVDLLAVDLLAVDFLAVAFDGLLARTGRSLMARTSLSSDIPTLGREAALRTQLTP